MKLRIKAGSPRIQIFYDGLLSYCNVATDLTSNQWYHFAFVANENPEELGCYLDGVEVPVGSNPIIHVTADVKKFEEIGIGHTQYQNGTENNFEGYIKEFRWWRIVRTPYDINYFKNTYYDPIPS